MTWRHQPWVLEYWTPGRNDWEQSMHAAGPTLPEAMRVLALRKQQMIINSPIYRLRNVDTGQLVL